MGEGSFTYYALEGTGTVVSPNTYLHYFGIMKLLLTAAPACREEDER